MKIKGFTVFTDFIVNHLCSTVQSQFYFVFARYYVLMRGVALSDDIKERCLLLLQIYDNGSAEWQLGKTKVRNMFFEMCECVGS